MKAIRFAAIAAAVAFCAAAPRVACAWAHQGHLLITRMAALRIIDDPTAPQGLRDFLRRNTPAMIDNCRALALTETMGINPGPQYLRGIDGACTLPDRIQFMPGGQEPVAPYGVRELYLHFVDLEYLTPGGQYKDDLSGRPAMAAVPRDIHDPHYKRAGYAPFRVQECYDNLVSELARGGQMDNDAAVKWAGYLAHYVEDVHQPHHTTSDHKSITYLAGQVPGVPAAAATQPTEAVRLPPGMNPHGDVEYQLFENADPPRGNLRQRYWTELRSRIKALAAEPITPDPPGTFDPWSAAVGTMYDSYDYLPLIGRAARAAYRRTGKFDPNAFFTYTWSVHGETISVIDMVALQNAKATLAVEKIWRQAWADAQAKAAK